MKIWARIPVARIDMPMCAGFTFRHEVHEVEVIRVIRYPASKNKALNRWHYQAHIKDHPRLLLEAKHGFDGPYRVNIQRRGLNSSWVPPDFGDGNVHEIAVSENIPPIQPLSA